MTTAESAEYLGMSRRHVRELISAGKLPAEKEETQRGPVYWLKRADLDAFRQTRVQESEARKGKPGRPPKVPPEPS